MVDADIFEIFKKDMDCYGLYVADSDEAMINIALNARSKSRNQKLVKDAFGLMIGEEIQDKKLSELDMSYCKRQ